VRTTTKLKNSERRLRKQQKSKPLPKITLHDDYDETSEEIHTTELEIAALERTIEKKLIPLKVAAGVLELERRKEALEEKMDDLWNEKERLENLVIDDLVKGKDVTGFVLRIVAKRLSVSYKGICEEVFKNAKDKYQALKDKFGGRKEQYVLVYKGEEITHRDISPA